MRELLLVLMGSSQNGGLFGRFVDVVGFLVAPQPMNRCNLPA